MRPLAVVQALARTTAQDGLRAPVTGVVLLLGAVLTLVSPEIAIFTLGNGRAFALDLGASTVLLAAIFLAATTGALGAAERVNDGTALVVLTKAVRPLEYVVGVYLGTVLSLLLGGYVLLLAILHAAVPGGPWTGWIDAAAVGLALAAGVRASRAGGSFQVALLVALAVTGTAAVTGRLLLRPDAVGGESGLVRTAVLAASLAFCAGCAYSALGLVAAMRLAPALAASLTLGAAVLGAATQGVTAQEGSSLATLAWVIPDLSLFSIADAAYSDTGGIPASYLGGVALWTAAYATGALAVAAALLDRRELG